MDEVRKTFEDFAGHRYGEDELSFSSEDETYDSWLVQDAWEVWQASRAALVVELPRWDNFDTTSQVLSAVIDELKSEGITVKGESQ